jgi:hypothetical protein
VGTDLIWKFENIEGWIKELEKRIKEAEISNRKRQSKNYVRQENFRILIEDQAKIRQLSNLFSQSTEPHEAFQDQIPPF